ncbi:VOC family protein [Sedimentitalea sp. JM2-8]|uniref:VOC family protein n=1 Tax=Sedimentitalea xiamensis TaxID=3050037 RepID=A0ABT7FHU5_9RHOB|nr:VOC family protein [Sedimentitalea xiamensis]MDK3074653.1 VOC family protein [Sedimentitalea xiamensis]
MKPTIYLFFKGNCLEAMQFYADTLGGEITGIFRNGDAPNPEHRMPGGDDLVMNMAMSLDGATVMASDSPDAWYQKPQGFRISIPTETRPEFDRIYAALADRAENVAMEPDETFWADRFAMLTDRFGTPWMLMFEGSKKQ